MYGEHVAPCELAGVANASVTAGLKCAPEIGPKIVISTHRPHPVAMLLREQRDRRVAAGQSLAHDPGTDDDREQECRAERFGGEPARKRHCLPMSLTVSLELQTVELVERQAGEQLDAALEQVGDPREFPTLCFVAALEIATGPRRPSEP